MFTLKHLKMLQHVSILFRSSSGSSYVPCQSYWVRFDLQRPRHPTRIKPAGWLMKVNHFSHPLTRRKPKLKT